MHKLTFKHSECLKFNTGSHTIHARLNVLRALGIRYAWELHDLADAIEGGEKDLRAHII